MGKIKHVSRVFSDLREMEEIPSEFIEPYLVTYLSMVIESVGFGFETPAEVREDLKGVERFISLFGGLHARLAIGNKYGDFCRMSDEEMIKICKQVCEENYQNT